ncbi:MAG: hypothetical protein M1826_007552 [Phylliscum demangeonii]|nr:MAG: hypothetical protein M1826_007552 [Phylliscum demangeonii]
MSGLLFGLAMIAATARFVVRVRLQRRLLLEDIILLFACALLIAGSGLLYHDMEMVYLQEALVASSRPDFDRLPKDWLRKTILNQKTVWAYLVLSSSAIFAVKFTFLSFFRALVDRQQKMLRYWWVVVVITALAWGACATYPFYDCPRSAGPPIVAIPICLLWKIRVRARQKVVVGFFLCLSIAMVTTAIVRVSGLFTPFGDIDIGWLLFWQQVEACVAVALASFTAFRSIFVAEASKRREARVKASPSALGRRWARRRQPTTAGDAIKLPSIPSATLTGLRTFLRGGHRPHVLSSVVVEADNDANGAWLPLHKQAPHVTATHDISIEHVMSGLLFGLAMIAATARFVVRLRLQRRLFLEDIILLFACALLIAGTGLLYKILEMLYFMEDLVLSPQTALSRLPPEFFQTMVYYQNIVWAYLVVSSTAIFAVKFTFLSFFRALVDRQQKMLRYWRVVVVITVLAWGGCASYPFWDCPHSAPHAMQCATSPGNAKAPALAAIGILLDIVTDLMIVAIPICLLWKVRVRARQKVVVGFFLCLSIVIMITAIVRVSGLATPTRTIDVTWILFWQQVEACVAVTLASFTAFRSIFVAEASKRREARGKTTPSGPGRRWTRWKRSTAAADDDAIKLPSIPSATLTGLRTFIRGSHRSPVLSSVDAEEGSLPLEKQAPHVRLTHDISIEHI